MQQPAGMEEQTRMEVLGGQEGHSLGALLGGELVGVCLCDAQLLEALVHNRRKAPRPALARRTEPVEQRSVALHAATATISHASVGFVQPTLDEKLALCSPHLITQ